MGILTENISTKLTILFKKLGELFNETPHSFDDLFDILLCCYRKIKYISQDMTHPLFHRIKRSTRTGGIQLILTRTEWCKYSFVHRHSMAGHS